jgi:dolichyl-phosphate-mannose-protein mannosyltransferase
MATTGNAAVASGAEYGDALRRRNVAAAQPASQPIVQVEDKKKLQKKVRVITRLLHTSADACYTL